jgi:diguanylate cyclase (GGDEF)-like protein/PAS domain S-box-containing protein
MPIVVGQWLSTQFSGQFIDLPLHSVLETVGGTTAIIIAIIFYIKFQYKKLLSHFNWSGGALLVMGILDIFHAAMLPGELFVWLHSVAVFFGGIFFTLVWLPTKRVSQQTYQLLPTLFITFAIVFALGSILFSSHLPTMLNPDKSFTQVANLLNVVGGIGFFLAALKFLINYVRTKDNNDLLFAGHTMLFGIAGVLFVSSVVWDIQWWLWHILRLSAYAIAFYFLYKEYRVELDEVEASHKKIRQSLAIIDEHVITSSTDPQGVIEEASQAFCAISGYTKEELIGKPHSIVRHPDTPKALYEELWQTIKQGKTWHGEIQNRHKNGTAYWVSVTISPEFDEEGKIARFTAIRYDITDRKKVEQLSITDELTQLYNRRYFNQIVEKEIFRAQRANSYLGLLSLDIDYFKYYNDTYGHQQGDEVLKAIAHVLLHSAKRASDFAFRLGGEEFAILFSGEDQEHAVMFANSILHAIEQLNIDHQGSKVASVVTASIGLVVQRGNHLSSAETIYKEADQALYEAKTHGRNQVILYDAKKE